MFRSAQKEYKTVLSIMQVKNFLAFLGWHKSTTPSNKIGDWKLLKTMVGLSFPGDDDDGNVFCKIMK